MPKWAKNGSVHYKNGHFIVSSVHVEFFKAEQELAAIFMLWLLLGQKKNLSMSPAILVFRPAGRKNAVSEVLVCPALVIWDFGRRLLIQGFGVWFGMKGTVQTFRV